MFDCDIGGDGSMTNNCENLLTTMSNDFRPPLSVECEGRKREVWPEQRHPTGYEVVPLGSGWV